MKHYCADAEQVMKEVASTQSGLSPAEAARRLEANGKNKLAEGKKDSLLKRFIDQLMDPMILILLAAAAISGVLAVVEGESFTDVIIILAVVIVNAVLGVYQESKAEKAIEALQEMSAATSRVLRDGKIVTVHSEDLVVGDVILLEAGDAVPADARLMECHSLKAEESALTGESVPVNKTDEAIEATDGNVPLGDRINMVYSGSTVVYGRGTAVITATGMDTEMGKIATAITTAGEGKTPLQIKLAQLSEILTYLVLGICVFIFGFNIVEHLVLNKPIDLTFGLSSFMTAVSLGVDLFDCVMPSRNARHGQIFTWEGIRNLNNNKYAKDPLPLDENCGCPVCQTHSRAYLRHLLKANEMLGMRLLVMHNLWFYNHLMEVIREKLEEGTYLSWMAEQIPILGKRI